MLLFLCVIALSPLLLRAAGTVDGPARRALLAASVLVPCVAAGLRDSTVGTDVEHYLVWMVDESLGESLPEFLRLNVGISGTGFNLLVWLSSRAGGLHGAMFAAQLAVVAPLYAEFWRQGRRTAWLGALVYCLVLFAPSLNAMKQFAAMAVCAFGYRYMAGGNRVKLLACVLVAMQFHQTAAFYAAFYPVFLLVDRYVGRPGEEPRAPLGWAPALATVAAVAVLAAAAPALVQIAPALKDSYGDVAAATGRDVNLSALAMFAGVAALGLAACLRMPDPDGQVAVCRRDVVFFAVMSAAAFALFQLDMLANSLMRLGFYALPFLPFLAQALASLKGRRARFAACALPALCACYSYVVVAVLGGYGVYPFTSALIGVG